MQRYSIDASVPLNTTWESRVRMRFISPLDVSNAVKLPYSHPNTSTSKGSVTFPSLVWAVMM